MHEKLVIVPKKMSVGHKIWMIFFFALTCFCLLMCAMNIVYAVIFLIPAFIFGVVWYVFAFRSEVEWEYTYYDGDLKFARIKNKSKRKKVANLNMEDVLIIAPAGDRGLYKYENDRNMIFKDITSGVAGAKVYNVVAKTEKGMARYAFEPDEDMLDEIRVKYPRSVVK